MGVLDSSVWQTSTALRTCCQVICEDGPLESTACSYFRVTESLEASSRPTQTVMDTNHWERSECTQHQSAHGMETSSGSVNNGNEPWKRLCSNLGPVLDDDDDGVTLFTHSISLPCSPSLKCNRYNATLCYLHVWKTIAWQCSMWFLANVNSSSCSLYVIGRPSVCNVRAPYSGDWNFRQCFYAVWYLRHPWPFCKNFMEIVPGEFLCQGS